MTNPIKHPYAPELCALLNGKVIVVQFGGDSEKLYQVYLDNKWVYYYDKIADGYLLFMDFSKFIDNVNYGDVRLKI